MIHKSNHQTTIWKPPESVSNARGQFINLWRPPNSSMSSEVGRRAKWYVFPRIIWHPISSSWLVVKPFIVPVMNKFKQISLLMWNRPITAVCYMKSTIKTKLSGRPVQLLPYILRPEIIIRNAWSYIIYQWDTV